MIPEREVDVELQEIEIAHLRLEKFGLFAMFAFFGVMHKDHT